MADRYTWVARYADGSCQSEHELGTFGRVDLVRCVAVEIIPARGLVRRPVVTIRIDPNAGQRAVFLRRRRLTVHLSPSSAAHNGSVTVAGWQGPSGEAYVVIDDTGRIQALSDLTTI